MHSLSLEEKLLELKSVVLIRLSIRSGGRAVVLGRSEKDLGISTGRSLYVDRICYPRP